MRDLHQLKREIAEEALALRDAPEHELQSRYETLVQKLDKFVWIAERKNRDESVRSR